MTIAGGIGRFASRTTISASAGNAVPPALMEADRPSSASTFASCNVTGSHPLSSSEFSASSDFDENNFEDPFVGAFERENFNDYGGGNFDNDPVDDALMRADEEETDLIATNEYVETRTNQTAAKNTNPEQQSTSDQGIVPPPGNAETSTTNTPPTSNVSKQSTFSPKICGEVSLLGLKLFGSRRSISIPANPRALTDVTNCFISDRNTDGMANTSSGGTEPHFMQKRSTSQSSSMKLHAQVMSPPATTDKSLVVQSGSCNHSQCQKMLTTTGSSQDNSGGNFGLRTTQHHYESTPLPIKETLQRSLDSAAFFHVTPDASTPVMVNSPHDMLDCLSSELASPIPLVNIVEGSIQDISSSGEDFEKLFSDFLEDLQSAEDLQDHGDDGLLSLNVDMTDTHATTLHIRSQMIDILNEVDHCLEIQNEVICEQQEMLK